MYMKKIRIKMAGMDHETKTDETIAKTGDHAKKGEKKIGILQQFKKGIGKYMPKSPPKPVEPQVEPTPKKEITVEDVKEQIQNNELWDASKNLIVLEHKIFGTSENSVQQDKDKEELKSLYEDLFTTVFKVIKRSITETQRDLLTQAVQAIVEQEKEDANYVSNNGSMKKDSHRPKLWKREWENYVKLSVVERIDGLPEILPNDTSSSLSQSFMTVGNTIKKDLIHVVKNLKPTYPKEFDVCNTYAQHYHQVMTSQIAVIAEYELEFKDSCFLLYWVKNFYPNTILKDPELDGHIDLSKLGHLLSSFKVQEFQDLYLCHEMDSVRDYMYKILVMEDERWKSGKEPEMLGDYYHSELHIDIIQCYNGGMQRASELLLNMTTLLVEVVEAFFIRYKLLFTAYSLKNKTQTFFTPICIANLNCCHHFREFFKSPYYSPLIQDMEDCIYSVLFEDLFVELKSHFRKISQSNGLCSHQTMTDIIKITDRHLSPFRTLCTPSYKDMISRVHKHLVKEYLTRLLKKKVSHKSAAQLQALANQINQNAKLLEEFFASHNSEEHWLNPAIFKIAEIIRLQDLSAIQLEVATLVEEYPDIRNKQIEAILYIKGNLTRSDTKSIMKIIDSVERRLSEKPKLFELI